MWIVERAAFGLFSCLEIEMPDIMKLKLNFIFMGNIKNRTKYFVKAQL